MSSINEFANGRGNNKNQPVDSRIVDPNTEALRKRRAAAAANNATSAPQPQPKVIKKPAGKPVQNVTPIQQRRQPVNPGALTHEEILRRREENAAKNGIDPSKQRRGRDLGNGRFEMNPAQMGIVEEYEEEEKSSFEKTMDLIDGYAQRKTQEIQQFNEGIDAFGEITEQELLDMQGKGYITQIINEPERLSAMRTVDQTAEEANEKVRRKDAAYAKRDAEIAARNAVNNDGIGDEDPYGMNDLNLPDDKDPNEPYITNFDDLGSDDEEEDELDTPQETVELPDMFSDDEEYDEEPDYVEDMIQGESTDEEPEEDWSGETVAYDEVVEEEEEETFEPTVEEYEEQVEEEPETEDDEEETEAEPEEEAAPVEEDERPRRTDEEIAKLFSDDIKARMLPAVQKFDLSTLTVVSSISVKQSKPATKSSIRVKWPLFTAKRPVTVSTVMATEIEDMIDANNDNSNVYASTKKMFSIVYKHIIGPKPASVEEWAKTVPFSDYNHLFYALFMACFNGANYIPANCVDTEHCRRIFVSENVPMKDMVEFINGKEGKAKYNAIINMSDEEVEAASSIDVASEVLIPGTDYSIVFRRPSIYDVRFEPNLLTRDEYKKYSRLIINCIYIKEIYKVDFTKGTKAAIKIPYIPGNAAKNYKAKLKTYKEILDSFNPAQMNSINAVIRSMDGSQEGVNYVYPELTCPDCGKTVPKQNISDMASALFTVFQLPNWVM